MGLQNSWSETYFWNTYFFALTGKETKIITLALVDYVLNISNQVKLIPGVWRVLVNTPESKTDWVLLGLKEIKDDQGLS